jgi:hypothetical protein
MSNKKLKDMTKAEIIQHPTYKRRVKLSVEGAISKILHGIPTVQTTQWTDTTNRLETIQIYSNTHLFCTINTVVSEGQFKLLFTPNKSTPSSIEKNSIK